MAITNVSMTRRGTITTVTATSDLGGSPIYYHWYMDGVWVGVSTSPSRDFSPSRDEQIHVEVIDTLDADHDPYADPPEGYPARRTLWWIRSLAEDVDYYRIDQKLGGGAWTEIGRVAHDPAVWDYRWLTQRLNDLSTYHWRVVPVDIRGNAGSPLEMLDEYIVRVPDAPEIEATIDEETGLLTVAAV